jgi:5-methylcytosine-specific restriction endonuclease McrA
VVAKQEIPICPFCKRPAVYLKRHHLVPRSRGGKGPESTVGSCLACHRAIHALFSNKELAEKYNTVEALMANDRFRKQIAWIAKQDPSRKLRTRRSADRKKQGKYR